MDDACRESAPLSYEQEQLWFLHQLAPDMPMDNECATVIFRGELDVEALGESLGAFIQRHEIWRTIFPSRDGQPMQVVQAQGQWTWLVADLSVSWRSQSERKRRSAGRKSRRSSPSTWRGGRWCGLCWCGFGEQEYRLFLTLHRSFSTASLTQVFLPELRELYEARVQGRAANWMRWSCSTADYATWQREKRQEEELGAHLKFWKEYLAGAPTVLELPGDRRRPATAGATGAGCRHMR